MTASSEPLLSVLGQGTLCSSPFLTPVSHCFYFLVTVCGMEESHTFALPALLILHFLDYKKDVQFLDYFTDIFLFVFCHLLGRCFQFFRLNVTFCWWNFYFLIKKIRIHVTSSLMVDAEIDCVNLFLFFQLYLVGPAKYYCPIQTSFENPWEQVSKL